MVQWSFCPSCFWAVPSTRPAERPSQQPASQLCSMFPPHAPTSMRGSFSTCGSQWRTALLPTSGPASPQPSPSSVSFSSKQPQLSTKLINIVNLVHLSHLFTHLFEHKKHPRYFSKPLLHHNPFCSLDSSVIGLLLKLSIFINTARVKT